MENLTMLQRVFRPHTGLDPLEGYAVVVYEQMGASGAEFRGIIRPGERLNRTLLSRFRATSYLAIAVNLSPELRFSFTDHIKLDDQINEFNLSFDLSYRVGDAETVATLRNEDPLRQVRDEIIRVVGRRIIPATSEDIQSNFREIEVAVIHEALSELRTFSATFGLEITTIALDRSLPPWWVELRKLERDQAAAKGKMALANETEDMERRRLHEKRVEDEENQKQLRQKQLQGELELLEHEELVHASKRKQKVLDGVADAGIDAFIGTAQNIKTPAELKDGLDVLVHASSAGLDGGRNRNAEPQFNSLLGGEMKLLGNGRSWIELLPEAAQIESWTTYPIEQRRSLSSAILHVIAEMLLDDHADEDALERYGKQIFDLSRKLSPPLSIAQSRMIEKFKKYDKLREDLK